MTLWTLVERGISQRRLSSILTTLSVALGVMLVTAIFLLRAEMEDKYLQHGEGFSLVIGPAKTAELSVVLNAVYHVGQPPGLLPYPIYKELSGEAWRRYLRLAVPYAVGDTFRGYRVVATTDAIFSPHFPPKAKSVEEKLQAGRPFRFRQADLDDALQHLSSSEHKEHAHPEEEIFEAVVGSEVARALGITVGTKIEPTHGVEGEAAHKDEHLWEVVGILKPTRTPLDRVVFINLDSFYRIGDHVGAVIPGTGEPALSAILLIPRPGYQKAFLLGELSKRTDLVVAEVANEVRKLLEIVGRVDEVFLVVCVLVVIIGIVSIMVAIYNTMNERRRELAILRALGARRRTVVMAIVGEAATLTFMGAVLGVFFAHALLALVGGHIEAASGLRPDPWRMLPLEVPLVLSVTVIGGLAGLIPAWRAYRTDVAKNLAPLS